VRVERAFQYLGRRERLLVPVFFLTLTLLFTWPLPLHLHDGVLGNNGDPLLNSWIIAWDARTLVTHPLGLFQGNVIYPARDVLAYSEHMFTLGVLALPVYWISRSPLLAYNLLLLLAFLLSACGAYLLVRELTGSRWAALLGGTFFAFCPYRLAQLNHLQVLFSPFLPLMVLHLHRYLERGGRKELALFFAFYVAQSLASWHHLAFCSLLALSMWAWKAVFSRRSTDWKRLGLTAAALVAAAAVSVPFALPYLRAFRRLPDFQRSLAEVRDFSAGWRSFLNVLPQNLLYGAAKGPLVSRELGYEKVFFPGFLVVLLALAGLLRRWKKEPSPPGAGAGSTLRTTLYFLLLAGVSLLLTLGPEVGGRENYLYSIPYRLGLLRFMRVPARFYVPFSLALAVLGGLGAARLVALAGDRLGRKGVGAAGLALAGLLLLELLSFNWQVFPVATGEEATRVYEWLSRQGEARVIELPTPPLAGVIRYDRDLDLIPRDLDEYFSSQGLSMYYSTLHWKKVVNGYSGYFPYCSNRIFTEMQAFPSQRTLELLRCLDVDYLVWDWERVEEWRHDEFRRRLASSPGLHHLADHGHKSLYALDDGPAASGGDLRVEAVVPRAVAPEAPFNAGVRVTNSSAFPYFHAGEDPQEFTATFLDEEGKVVAVEKGKFRPPFFLQGGEGVELPLRVTGSPQAGLYRLVLDIRGDAVGERSFSFSLAVGEMPLSSRPGRLDGDLEYEGGEPVNVPAPEGLFPLRLRVRNTGDTLWTAAGADKAAELEDPRGLVHVAVRWEQAEGPVWEEQRCTLPCDVAPGQEVEVNTMVRPPDVPGRYMLFVGLTDEGFHWFGEVRVLQVEVAAPGREGVG